MSLALQLALSLAAFVAVTAIAAVAGADGLGRAATFGILAFAAVLVAVLVRWSPRRD